MTTKELIDALQAEVPDERYISVRLTINRHGGVWQPGTVGIYDGHHQQWVHGLKVDDVIDAWRRLSGHGDTAPVSEIATAIDSTLAGSVTI